MAFASSVTSFLEALAFSLPSRFLSRVDVHRPIVNPLQVKQGTFCTPCLILFCLKTSKCMLLVVFIAEYIGPL